MRATPPIPLIPPITREQLRDFEMLQHRSVEALMRPVGAIEGNGQGYAYFDKGEVHATLSTNPYAVWTVQTYGLIENLDPQTLDEVMQFFRSRGVKPMVRVVP